MCDLQKLPLKFLQFIILFLILLICRDIRSQKIKMNSIVGLAAPINDCWNYPTKNNTPLKIASDNRGTLYSSLSDGKLISINADSAEKIWETELGGEIISIPLIEGESIYIVVNYILSQTNKNLIKDRKTTLRSLDKITGLTKWETDISATGTSVIDKAYINLNLNEDFLIITGDNGSIRSIKKATGQVVWKRLLTFEPSSLPLLEVGKFVLGVSGNQIITLSADDGRLLEELNVSAKPTAIARDKSGNNLVWGDEKGLITSMNEKTKLKTWTFRKGGKISGINITVEGLLVTCLDNFIYLISEISGKQLWKRRLTGRSLAEPLIEKYFTIITMSTEPTAFIIDLRNGKLVNKISLESDNLFTGDFARLGNFLIYSTTKGISAVSVGAECLVE